MIYSVGEVNHLAKQLFDGNPLFQNIEVNGEISGAKLYSSGHFYFTLKDENATLRCVIFRSYFAQLGLMPRNGDKVTVKGSLTIYEPSGQYQLIGRTLKPQGIGDLHLQFERLKEELARKGYFASEHKKKIPVMPRIIGVATSQSGAVFHDIQSVLRRRFPGFVIHFIPVAVQGEGAAAQIAAAIDRFNQMAKADVIIIGRGGGSIEDLWAFNERIVAESIYRSEIPIISAVGHETDFTIADFVADLRAPTPSAAAELVIIEKEKLFEDISSLRKKLEEMTNRNLENLKRDYLSIASHPLLKYPERLFEQYMQMLDDYHNRLKRELQHQQEQTEQNLFHLNKDLTDTIRRRLSDQEKNLNSLASRLNALNPFSILERGYSYVSAQDGGIISSVEDLSAGDLISLYFNDGSARAEIKETERRQDKE